MNKFIGIGRLTNDPQIKTVGSKGTQLANFSIAINRNFNKEETDFINCVVWGKGAEYFGKYAKKGQLVSIEGELNINKSGDKYFTQVNVAQAKILTTKAEMQQSGGSSFQKATMNETFDATPSVDFDDFEEDITTATTSNESKNEFDISEDDMPF